MQKLMNRDNESVITTYFYEGRCPFSGELLRLPRTNQAEAIALNLMQELSQLSSQLNTREGKMYGILLAESITGEQIILKAFSGLLNGKSHMDGWVSPIAGRENVAIAESITLAKLATIKQKLIDLSQIPERLDYEQKSQEFAIQLADLQAKHQISKQNRQIQRSQSSANLQKLDRESQLEKMARRNLKRDRDLVLLPLQQAIAAADEQMSFLKQARRQLSRTLQTQMHHAYVLTNFAGETRSLKQILTEGSMPTGIGDCCAPKLLDYAANKKLKPIAMAEFWWGNPSADGYKIQGEFYGACVERCQPIMGFLLSTRRSSSTSFKAETIETSLNKEDVTQALTVIYEDEDVIAIAKPAGLLSIPGRYLDTQDSVLSRLQQSLSDRATLYPVHRLDRQTSGILLFSRNLETLRDLNHQFQNRKIHKIYEALLSGIIAKEHGTIDLSLWGNPENRPYQQVDFERGKPSITKFKVIHHEVNHSRIEFVPLTGRTHQLRVHAGDVRGLGITILGDRLYGCQAATDRLHLHARELTFVHPRSQESIHLQIPVPF